MEADLSRAELWRRYREGLWADEELGVRLDLSRMRLPSDLLSRMGEPMDAALAAMEALEAGEIANPDEGRRVGHYWLRAPELAPDTHVAEAIRATRARIERFAAQVHAGTLRPPTAPAFRRLLVIGIGGSALGPQLVADALGTPEDRLAVSFLDNTDPDGFERVLGGIGEALGATLVIVVSKSGGTPETRNGMLAAQAALRARGLAFGPHAVAVTQEGSTLDRTALAEGFLDRFPMWDWVGGRTSLLSAVGLLPAALQGVDIGGLLAGAAAMDRHTRGRDAAHNPAALLALAWHHAGEGAGTRDMVVLPYKDRLVLWSRYLQQLVMESLGKERDLAGRAVHQGIAVYGNKGSTDQHAYVQQLRDGLPGFFVTFVQVLEDEVVPGRAGLALEEVEPGITAGDYLTGFLLGTREALADRGRLSLTVTLRRLDARSLGALVALYERAVGLYAGLIGINAYHQPGVEAGKKAASTLLDLQRRALAVLQGLGERGGTAEEVAAGAGVPDRAEDVLHLLEHLAANPRRGLARRPGLHPAETVFHLRT